MNSLFLSFVLFVLAVVLFCFGRYFYLKNGGPMFHANDYGLDQQIYPSLYMTFVIAGLFCLFIMAVTIGDVYKKKNKNNDKNKSKNKDTK